MSGAAWFGMISVLLLLLVLVGWRRRNAASRLPGRHVEPEAVEAMLRALRGPWAPRAVEMANARLDEGATVEQLLRKRSKSGLTVRVERLSDRQYRIHIACTPGRLAGDGGTWDATIDEGGRVSDICALSIWVS
jgi:hypothetical protein